MPGPTARTLATARLRRAIVAADLTQERAGGLLKRDARQVRRWLSGRVSLGPLELLCAIEAATTKDSNAGGSHAASLGNYRGVSDHASQQPSQSENGAHGGQIETTNLAEWSPCTQDVGALALKRSDTCGEHTAQACGAMASELYSRSAPTVSVTAGWSSMAARRAHNPKVGGSNPSPATPSCLDEAAEQSARRGIPHQESSDGQEQRGTLGRAHVVKPVLNPTEGESPSRSANALAHGREGCDPLDQREANAGSNPEQGAKRAA
jgi:hypothetical protein